MIIGRYFYDHPILGKLIITIKNDIHSYTARWKVDGLHVSCPQNTNVDRLNTALESMMPRLLKNRPVAKYSVPMTISVDSLDIHISRQSLAPDKANLFSLNSHEAGIALGSDLDVNSPETQRLITNTLKITALKYAPSILLPMARDIAARFGLKPTKWSIGRGDRRLGCCNSKGEISLSRICVFLTPELRQYIICHELAHLSEMNHSPRFHSLCNKYLCGREQELIDKLKHYNWPILR